MTFRIKSFAGRSFSKGLIFMMVIGYSGLPTADCHTADLLTADRRLPAPLGVPLRLLCATLRNSFTPSGSLARGHGGITSFYITHVPGPFLSCRSLKAKAEFRGLLIGSITLKKFRQRTRRKFSLVLILRSISFRSEGRRYKEVTAYR